MMWCTPEEHRKLERRAIERPELDDGKALVARIERMVSESTTEQQKVVARQYLFLLRNKCDKHSHTVGVYVDSGQIEVRRVGPWAKPYEAAYEAIERLNNDSQKT